MFKKLSLLLCLMLITSNSWATVGWLKNIPASTENPQNISPDVIENNTALDLVLSNYRNNCLASYTSGSTITVGSGEIVVSNSAGTIRLMVANTSSTSVTSASIDTGTIAASTTYYLYAYAASTTATTFGCVFSTSSTTPTGITYFKRLGSFVTDGSANFTYTITNDNVQPGFGTRVSKSNNTVYQATTDGFVNAQSASSDVSLIGYTDSNNPPTTQIAIAGANSSPSADTRHSGSIMFPVIKGNYWEVTNGGTIYWTPSGS